MLNRHALAALALMGAGCVGPWDPALTSTTDDTNDTDDTSQTTETGDTGDTTTELVPLHPRCTQVYPDGLTLPVDPEETFLIGTVFDHSLDTHVARYQSAQLAAIQANGNDGLEGRSFAMIHCTNEEGLDELDKDAASLEVAVWLAEVAGVPAIVGPAASSRAEAVYNAVADQFGTLVISPSATSPSLTPLDGLTSSNSDPGLFWRTAPPDDIQGAAIAWDMLNQFDAKGQDVYRQEPSTNVAVVYQAGAYGEGLEAAFSAELVAGGGDTTAFRFDDDTSRSDAIAQVANGGFQEVLFASSDSSDVIEFIQASVPLSGVDGMPIFLTDAARNADVLGALSGNDERLGQVRGTVVSQPAGLVYDSFASSYASEFDTADVSLFSYTAQSFDAAWLVIMGHAWAIHQEGGISGRNIARGLRRVSSGTETEIRPTSWNLVKASFEEGMPVDVVGASGELDYDATTGETAAPIDVWVVNDSLDDFEVVERFVP